MDGDDKGILAVSLRVVGHVNEGGDLPLSVLAGIVHQEWLDQVLAAEPADQRMRHLQGLCLAKS